MYKLFTEGTCVQTVISKEFDGRTLKDWLYSNNISRGIITHLKKLPNGMLLNGEHVTVRKILKQGDILSLELDDRSEDTNDNLIPTEMPLDILYEDDDMIALNKPFDMATHPSIGHFTDTLANGLCYYFTSRSIPFVFRSINRLDRDTSGIVLVAKSRHAASRLTALMQTGKIRKSYVAVLNNKLLPESGRIDLPIRRKEASIILREVCSADCEDGKAATTAYETIASNADATVVRAEPITGRTHQLRVHFSHMGCPIIGDGLYGYAESLPTCYDKMVTRQALHAASLALELDGGMLTIEAPLPLDMRKLLESTRKDERTL